jgi:hypothetical protein
MTNRDYFIQAKIGDAVLVEWEDSYGCSSTWQDIYQRLAPGVLAELKRLNPPTKKGYKKHRNHQFLTRDLGHPSLTRMLYEQIGMQSALDDGEWDRHRRIVDRRFPKFNDTIPLPLND